MKQSERRIGQQMENNEILGEMFDLNQTSPSIVKHNFRFPDIRSNIRLTSCQIKY